MSRRAWLALGTCAFWLCWPAVRLYAPRTRRTRALVCAGDTVLLVKGWFSDGRWGLPGGGLHRGEQVQQGAVRELFEETGIMVEPSSVTVLSEERLRVAGIPMQYVFCMVRIDTVATLHRRALEITETGWYNRDELSTLAVQPAVSHGLEIMAAHR